MAYSTPTKKRPATRKTTPRAPQKAGARPKKLSPAQLKKLAALFRSALRKEVAQMKRKPAARR